jgi:hypothetical protein
LPNPPLTKILIDPSFDELVCGALKLETTILIDGGA